MELHQLRYVVAVAEEGSFTAAAQRELVAQPAVSAAVRSLERELGVQLFRRGRSGAQPTEAGVAVLAHARAALAAVAAARDVADEVTGLLRGRVAVGMVVGCTSTVLADLLADFSTAHPAVEVVLVEGSGAHLLVALPPGTGGRTALDAACAAAGVTPVVACEATGLEMVCLLAERGLGTGVVPASVADAAGDRLRALPLDPPVTSRIELAWRTGGAGGPARAARAPG